MMRRVQIFLFILSLGVIWLVSRFEPSPGYMDAEYYFAGGLRLAQGYGFSEPFLWNYLDNPAGLPHPSHAYWMPLASIMAWLPMAITGNHSFAVGRLGFLLLAACIPPLTAGLAFELRRRREDAWLAGLLAVFPAFYMVFLPASDTFGIYMLLGLVYLRIANRLLNGGDSASRRNFRTVYSLPFMLGLVAGGMHLARADGVIWFGLALLLVIVTLLSGKSWRSPGTRTEIRRDISRSILGLLACALGYAVVMGPWFVRNLREFGTPLAPGGSKALWLTNYNELFIYPASSLTAARWWNTGLVNILLARWEALRLNLQSALAVQGEIFLLPLILWGLWRLRNHPAARIGVIAWVVTLAVMTLIFPYAGARGGFFHSGAAVQPLFWAVAPSGLEAFVAWGAVRRGWHAKQAWRIFGAGMVGISVLLSGLLVAERAIGPQPASPEWGMAQKKYQQLGRELRLYGAGGEEVVMVNDPPGYFLATESPAVPIPYGTLESMRQAAYRYHASYLILEINQVLDQPDLIQNPNGEPGLCPLGNKEGAALFRIIPVDADCSTSQR